MSWLQGGIIGWLESSLGMCGYPNGKRKQHMYVQARGELFEREVPGLSEDLLSELSRPGGSLEEKLQLALDTFRNSARREEGLQQVLTLTALDNHERSGAKPLHPEICQVIREGTYSDSILNDFDGQVFPLHAREIAPNHEYRLALEVHSGGKYWSSISIQDSAVRHKVEIVGGSSSTEGSATAVSQFGAAQRGAVYVWRWQHVPEMGPYDIPQWLRKALETEGNDPLRKIAFEIEAVSRWVQKLRQETALHIRQGPEIKDPYIREVLRLWPSDVDMHQQEQLKKCAWVEGLDPQLFVGKTVLIDRVAYDDEHYFALYATIAKRHAEEPPQEGDPPYRLSTSWQWTSAGHGTKTKLPSDIDVLNSSIATSDVEEISPAARVPEPGQRASEEITPTADISPSAHVPEERGPAVEDAD
mmetsp:Transcript_47379/g.112682  ORF Transcript_47379/g.112682 Transcript_47379/m.112682 type:complete len:416 (+) Transcript_47379:71-1318(+)